MAIWFVHRRSDSTIAWAGQYDQPGYADEQIDDATSAELQAFFAAGVAKIPPTPRQWLERLPADRQQAITDAVFAAGGAARVWYIKALGTPAINVTDPETVVGLAAMVGAGVITQGEQALLSAP